MEFCKQHRNSRSIFLELIFIMCNAWCWKTMKTDPLSIRGCKKILFLMINTNIINFLLAPMSLESDLYRCVQRKCLLII